MIKQLVDDMSRQIEELEHLQRAASQVTSIQSVASLLSPIQRDLSAWSAAFPLVKESFDGNQVGLLRQQRETLARQLSQARDRFAMDYGVPAGFNRIQQFARTLLDDTRAFWKRYAEDLIRPLRGEIDLARQLPQMHRDMEEIDRSYQALVTLCGRLPQNAAEVALFHGLNAQLHQRLNIVEGLTSEQTTFLEKVQRGSATVDDLSEPLLAWCHEQGLAGLLKIVF